MARWVTAVSAAGALAVMFTGTFAGVATAGETTPTRPDGTVGMGTIWDALATGDQDAIAGAAWEGTGMRNGTSGSIPLGRGIKVDRDPGAGLEPGGGEGIDMYGGGSFTSPEWSRIAGDSRNAIGGTSHDCWASYTLSASDGAGLNGAQVSAVIAYNRC